MPRPSRTLRLGDTAPALDLTDAQSGARFDTPALLRDRRGLLIVFHRGMW
ncbi:MAG TPA: hypothetical protein VFS44_03665 [Gemmatimonadaceae bacterium]|nr:hypothetical protein [Gemmatimonadaceae bacterium]